MAARQGTPGLGVLAEKTCERVRPETSEAWTVGVGYRYQPSYRHFIGTVEQKQRESLGTQILNIYHLMDISVERQITKRWSVFGSVPVVFDHRNQLYSPSSNTSWTASAMPS